MLASMSVNQPRISSCTILKASDDNMGLPIVPNSLAGRLSRSSMTISDDRAAASLVQALSDCWPQFVTVVSVRCLRSKLRVSPATAATGTHSSSSVMVGTILVDEDGIYDPRHPNDRLLLGMNRVVT